VFFTRHADKALADDGLARPDAVAVLRAGVLDGAPDLVNLEWRYRLRRADIFVVVEFETEKLTVVVTAWRKK
jgi:hypothetical protein